VNECTNTGLISALMLTIVLPMSYESVTDWLEEDYVSSGYAFMDAVVSLVPFFRCCFVQLSQILATFRSE
jgi:hypothetical protein